MANYFEHLNTDEDKIGCCKYLLKVLKKRALSDSVSSSLHMSEGTKRNVNKLFNTFMRKEDKNLRLQLLHMLVQKVQKHLKRSESTTLTALEVNTSKELAICLVKAMHESV